MVFLWFSYGLPFKHRRVKRISPDLCRAEAYISFHIPADHLLAASVMSCPAALAMAKLSYPETEICRYRVAGVRWVKRWGASYLSKVGFWGIF